MVILFLSPTNIFNLNESNFGPYQFVPFYFWITFIALNILAFIFIAHKSIQFKSIFKERICYLLLGLSFGILSIGSLSLLFPHSTLADSWHNTAFSEELILDGSFASTYVMTYPLFYIINGIILVGSGLSPEFLIQIYPLICLIIYLIGTYLLIKNFLKVFFPKTTNSQQNKAWLASFYFFCVFGSKLGLRINPAPQTLGYIFLVFFLAFFFKQLGENNNKNRILPIILLSLILFTHLIVFIYLVFFLLILILFMKEFRKEAIYSLLGITPLLVVWFFSIFMKYIYYDPFIQMYLNYFINFIIENYFLLIILVIFSISIILLIKYHKKFFKNKNYYWCIPGSLSFLSLIPLFDIINFNLYFIFQILIYCFIMLFVVYAIFLIFEKYIIVRNYSILWILSLSIFLLPWITYLFFGSSVAFLERIFLYMIIPCGVIIGVSLIKLKDSKSKYALILLFILFGFLNQISAQHNPIYAVDGDVVYGFKQLELNIMEDEDYHIIILYLAPPNIKLLKEGKYSGIDRPIEDYLDYLINGSFKWLYDVIYFCVEERAVYNYNEIGINLTGLVDYYFNLTHPQTIISPFYQGTHLTIWNITAI